MRTALQNFTGGEIAPTLYARYDLARYRNCLSCMENMLPGLHGDAARRPGTRFVADMGGYSVLIPFSFNALAKQNFVLVLGDHSLRIASERGLEDVAAIATPYAPNELLDISYAQVGDIVYLAHSNHPLHKIIRRDAENSSESGNTGSTNGQAAYSWHLEAVALNTSIKAPPTPTVTFSGTAGSYTLRYKVAAVDANGRESLASPAGQCTNGRHPSDWVQGNSAAISWPAVAGAVEYNIYREEAGYFGFIGVSAGLNFSDQNYQADTADTPKEDWNPFADGNYPGVVTFHQQRMVLAATPKNPQAFYMSRVGDFENFRKSRPLQNDDPVEYLIASGSIDAVTWAASFGDLLIGTSGSEYKATGGDGTAITPGNISITAQSYWGSAGLAPIIIGNSILHVQRHGSRVRDLFYSLEKDGYAGNDLSIMAPHLFEGHTILQWAYQQTPGSTIWCLRDDGLLLAFTYMKEHDIWGWSRQVTDGRVLSIAAVSGENGDVLMLVVERHINGQSRIFLERLASQWQDHEPIEEAFFVDCGLTLRPEQPATRLDGLDHLEGCELAVLADGSPVEGCVVHEGGIELPYATSVAQAGLPYASALASLPIELDGPSGTTLGRQRAHGMCTARLYRSVGGKYGPGRQELYDLPFLPEYWGQAILPYSGDVSFAPGGTWTASDNLWLVQDRPLPFRLLSLVLEVNFS
ncbi:hypothetical protein [Desulfovibrio intestinalis]|uniref:Uncharacterized protein n=1 Tax=Desulfovibrio intestinalis TaxID=58621 RepID=A0A7W8FFU3_9BACT|nr:hypothetical protein [Desulfovibrio intestinalis]MBB5143241.1 hypothetical protein [Desulfovibrio intestinalis]